MRWRTINTLTVALGLFAVVTASAQDSRPGIAVFSFSNGGSYGQDAENFDALQVGLQQILITELARNPSMRVVERGRIAEILAEQNLGAEGRLDEATMARVGRLIGAKYLVFGGFVDFYGDFRIDARIVNGETGEMERNVRAVDKREDLYQLVVSLAGQLTENINLPSLDLEDELEEQAREIPTEALTLYSRALFYADQGNKERAVEFYSRAIEVFPEYTEAREDLQQLRQS